jgi:hypothetical protein
VKISPAMIRTGLAQTFSFTVQGQVSEEPTLGKLMIAAPDKAFKPGCIYLTDNPAALESPSQGAQMPPAPAKSLTPPAPPPALLLTAGAPGSTLAARFEGIFVFPENTSLIAIHNAVQDIFDFYERWDADIHHILSAGSDVQAMLDASADIFKNPLVLHDNNFKIIAVSSSFADEPRLAPIYDNRRLPYLMSADRRASDAGIAQGQVLPLKIAGLPALYTNLFQNNIFKYRLLLIGIRRKLKQTDSVLMGHLSDYVQLAIGFVPERQGGPSGLAWLMSDIMSGAVTERRDIEQGLAQHAWKPEHRFVCLCVRSEIDETRNRMLRFMRERIAEVFRQECVFEHDDRILAVFNLTLYDGAENELYQVFTDFLQDNGLSAGASDAFTGFGGLRAHATQAEIALEYGKRQIPYWIFFRFQDYVKPFLLKSCTERLPVEYVCAPELIALKEYDARHGTDLLHTLDIYLRSGRKAATAAKKLFIHRSTFLYRLERIEKITGLNLTEDPATWYLLLSLELLHKEK